MVIRIPHKTTDLNSILSLSKDMPDPQQKQKEPIHGGDDDIVDDQPLPKPKLSKFASKPDSNIRDVFWDIMGLYATRKRAPRDLADKHKNSRMGFVRIAVSTLSTPERAYYGLSTNFTALYTIMFLIDEGWQKKIVSHFEPEGEFGEIGPGHGAITQHLEKKYSDFFVFET